MVKGVERLMPWRTLIEVARYSPHQIAICSIQNPEPIRVYEGISIYSVNYGIEAIKEFVEEGGWDVIYYPITYRQGLKNMRSLESLNVRKIAYVPGGIYPLEGSLALMQIGAVKQALPYIMDTLTPHSLIAKKLQNVGFEAIVCQSYLTGEDASKSGWNKSIVALPGKDQPPTTDSSLYVELGLQNQKVILFSGAPAPTRGAVLSMKAFDRIANELTDTKMVMLMRKDVSSDFAEFDKYVSNIQHKDKFVICYDKLTREQLFYFFGKAYAVVLPFLIVPSEIPLTFFEVMQMGTPVITFQNGGTTDYLNDAIKMVRHRSVRSFAKAIKELCDNLEERERLAKNAQKIMCNHPSWEQTSKEWLSVL